MDVFIVGEDDACKAVINRVLEFCSSLRNVTINIISDLPARGGQIKSLISKFNTLSASTPVILLTDLDNNGCPPSFIRKLLDGDEKNEDFILSVAVDEVEAWLLADRNGFANHFGVKADLIPEPSLLKMGGRKSKKEISCPCKTSLHFVSRILPHSRNKTLIAQLTPREGAVKGPEYNIVMTPFIRDHWNIESARINSDSLNGMISRVIRLIDKRS